MISLSKSKQKCDAGIMIVGRLLVCQDLCSEESPIPSQFLTIRSLFRDKIICNSESNFRGGGVTIIVSKDSFYSWK